MLLGIPHHTIHSKVFSCCAISKMDAAQATKASRMLASSAFNISPCTFLISHQFISMSLEAFQPRHSTFGDISDCENSSDDDDASSSAGSFDYCETSSSVSSMAEDEPVPVPVPPPIQGCLTYKESVLLRAAHQRYAWSSWVVFDHDAKFEQTEGAILDILGVYDRFYEADRAYHNCSDSATGSIVLADTHLALDALDAMSFRHAPRDETNQEHASLLRDALCLSYQEIKVIQERDDDRQASEASQL